MPAQGVPHGEKNLTLSQTGRGSEGRQGARKLLRAAAWTLTAFYFIAAVAVLVLQYWVLPDVGRHSQAIEQAVSRALGERVTIGEIGARWTGLHAELDLIDVRIHDRADKLALQLPAVQAVVGWRSILFGSLQLRSLALERPNLSVKRDAEGRLFVGGMALGARPGDESSSTWLLDQPEILVRDAQLSWEDELRGAPVLSLAAVNLVIRNRGDTHRLSLRASPSSELASALDIRAELEGARTQELLDWKARVFAQLDYVDLAAWKAWVDYPLEVQSGRGALRVWASLDRRRLTQATADVALADVRTRLAPELPLLDLEHLRGRLGAARDDTETAVTGRGVEMKLARAALLPAADFDFRWQAPTGKALAKGALKASAVALEPLASLVEYLPVPAALRERIAESEPRGTLQDFKLDWTGDGGDPATFSLHARFSGLALKKYADVGGFSGATGTADATESGGSLRLDSRGVVLDLARWMPGERMDLDSLVANVTWRRKDGQLELGFSNVAASNKDLAATMSGSFASRPRAGPEGADQRVLDLSASFPRIEGKAAWRYIPRLPPAVVDYLRDAIDGGTLSDVRLRIKGDLKDFPFSDPRTGVFQASGRITAGDLQFAQRWPRVNGITGELRFEGQRLQVTASRAAILAARVSGVRVQIADYYHGDPVVHVEGNVDGPVPEFLRYIEASPVSELIGGVTRGMSAGGPGRLQLTVDVPVRRLTQVKVAGAFQFAGGSFTFDPALPPLAQLNGRLDFTEEGLSARGLTAQFMGGPASFSIATRPERSVVVNAQGSATIAAVQKAFDLDWLQRASGSAAWTATANVGPNRFDLVVDSPLAGVAIALPAPLGKRPGETLPLRVERSTRADSELLKRARVASLPAGGDAIAFTAGKSVNGVFVRRKTTAGYALQRGALGVFEPAPPAEESGIALAGTFSYLDLDRWRGVRDDPKGGAGGEASLKSVRLSVNALDAGGKRFNDVRLRAVPAPKGGWSVDVSAKELEGTLGWQDEGRGRIVARLKRFTVPEPGAEAPSTETPGSELPALDIIADDFVIGDKKLGHLELIAANEARNWRIDKLLLSNPDSKLVATGLWQSWATRPSISLDLKLDVSDAGAFLARVGFPGTMRGGNAVFEGRVGWVGGPQAIDYPTLTGDVKLTAGKGQFMRAEPGVAKLLGILSLQTWLQLDFREALGDGFIFDTLSSSARINRGILATDDFAMAGKSARVTMAGSVDLAGETQNLRFRVVPSIGDSASTVVGLIGGPVTALGALAVQRLLKDPLGKLFAVEYAVTGSWSDPKVDRVRAETTQAGAPINE